MKMTLITAILIAGCFGELPDAPTVDAGVEALSVDDGTEARLAAGETVEHARPGADGNLLACRSRRRTTFRPSGSSPAEPIGRVAIAQCGVLAKNVAYECSITNLDPNTVKCFPSGQNSIWIRGQTNSLGSSTSSFRADRCTSSSGCAGLLNGVSSHPSGFPEFWVGRGTATSIPPGHSGTCEVSGTSGGQTTYTYCGDTL